MAHRVISLPHGNSVAFGLKRTLGRILRVDGLVSRPAPAPSSSRRGLRPTLAELRRSLLDLYLLRKTRANGGYDL
jgi:hypothetical protein